MVTVIRVSKVAVPQTGGDRNPEQPHDERGDDPDPSFDIASVQIFVNRNRSPEGEIDNDEVGQVHRHPKEQRSFR